MPNEHTNPDPTSTPPPPQPQRWQRLAHLPRQLRARSPFQGTIKPSRVPLLAPGLARPSLPFPHPWNYRGPLRILESFFWNADAETGSARHNRYLEVPGLAPVLITRDPAIIRAISAETGDKPGQFDRDTLPSTGIARATGSDTLLYANGPIWKRQKKLATPPFARTTLFQPEQFADFANTFRHTVAERLEAFRSRIAREGEPLRITLEPEIKALMLEMLVNTFFGAQVPYDQIRNRYVPSIDRVIDHIVRDTVINKLGIPLAAMPAHSRTKHARADFEQLTDLVIATRHENKGLWRQFKSDAPDEALRSNIRVFLAGALEATTSYASWAIAHLARNPAAQERLHDEIKDIEDYRPETLAGATYLDHVLNETLRLTPSLYFHPRRPTIDTTVRTPAGDELRIPAGTHILLDIWHANRHEDHWGIQATAHPAIEFVPERWLNIAGEDRPASERMLHFGFGHGPRFCPGKSLGQLEVALVVGACVKLFRFTAPNQHNPAKAGVSTKPLDAVLVDLYARPRATPTPTSTANSTSTPPPPEPTRCPYQPNPQAP
ncbi:MAG: cytochrome P450, partial [Phycisphaerales bacterium]